MTNAVLVHVCLVSAGATLGTALLSAAARVGNREDEFYLPYAAMCLAGTVVFLSLAALYDATTLAASVAALRWHIVGVLLVLPCMVWLFTRLARNPAARSEMRMLLIGTAVLLAANAFWPPSLHFDSIAAAPPGGVPGAVRQVAFVGRGGWVTAGYHLWLMLPIWFCFVNGLHVWRKGGRLIGAVATGSAGTFVAANVIGTRADYMGGVPAYLGGVPMLVSLILLLGLALGIAQRRQRLELVARGDDLRWTIDQLQGEVAHRARLEERLAGTQRLEALGRMAAGVAHDFNNVLTVAGGHAEILLNGVPSERPEHANAQAIVGAVARGAGLTRQLLAFARRQDLVLSEVDADHVLGGMRDLLVPLAGPRTELVLGPGAAGRAILADPTQFAQVVMNLVANARDAMPAGGRLSVRSEWIERPGPGTCACEGALERGHVQFLVADSGHGIDPETLTRIFEPFFTTKGPDEGTGLGLATVHGIVRQSGGHIAVASRSGEGTTFRICWPAPRAAAAPGPSPSAQSAGVRPA